MINIPLKSFIAFFAIKFRLQKYADILTMHANLLFAPEWISRWLSHKYGKRAWAFIKY